MRGVFAEVRRVLAGDGVLWLNLGDTFSSETKGSGGTAKVTLAGPATGSYFEPRRVAMDRPAKNLLGIPWRVAFALQDDGWILRNAVIWSKPNAMPESVRDRLSTRYEHVFLFAKSRRYWFDLDPIREPLTHPEALDGSRVFGGKNKADYLTTGSSARRTGNRYGAVHGGREQGDDHDAADPRGRNPGDVWTIATQPFPGAHFATMPPALARRCILAGCPEGGTVLDPFTGSGTTAMVARQSGRRFVGAELNPAYVDLIRDRIGQTPLDFGASA
jgi:site-specific DNA-methyltransferase (cytosine-N4-specific)